jgi:hypothetical protein
LAGPGKIGKGSMLGRLFGFNRNREEYCHDTSCTLWRYCCAQ